VVLHSGSNPNRETHSLDLRPPVPTGGLVLFPQQHLPHPFLTILIPGSPNKEYGEMIAQELLLTSIDPVVVARGRCADGAGTLASLFFSEDLSEIAQAKAMCANCDVKNRCFDGARLRREPWGVWGGELFLNGKVMSAKRRRGRPPKIRRHDDIFDELGQVISA